MKEFTELTIVTPNASGKLGQLAHIAAAFSKSRVNIDYIYATAVAYDQPAMVIIVHVAEAGAAEKALRVAKIT